MNKGKVDSGLILKSVTSIISEQLGIDEENIHLNSHFINDLGADSLGIVELMMSLEETFKEHNLKIPDEEAEKLKTVGDIVTYIEGLLLK